MKSLYLISLSVIMSFIIAGVAFTIDNLSDKDFKKIAPTVSKFVGKTVVVEGIKKSLISKEKKGDLPKLTTEKVNKTTLAILAGLEEGAVPFVGIALDNGLTVDQVKGLYQEIIKVKAKMSNSQ